jgi:hypothetical protein
MSVGTYCREQEWVGSRARSLYVEPVLYATCNIRLPVCNLCIACYSRKTIANASLSAQLPPELMPSGGGYVQIVRRFRFDRLG